jgi:hypothetical protein
LAAGLDLGLVGPSEPRLRRWRGQRAVVALQPPWSSSLEASDPRLAGDPRLPVAWSRSSLRLVVVKRSAALPAPPWTAMARISWLVCQSRLLSVRIRWTLGLTAGPGRNPCMKLTTATPAGAVTFLEASSWRYPCFAASSTGGNPRSDLRIGRRRRSCVVSSLEASPWWLVESSVCQL